ncbi:MAG TPA: hypothetical protein VEK79_15715 [Thermoanaerobaculia bacterium]|nr:hypothetical protein [Thermoanaerobaculia bacterium]
MKLRIVLALALALFSINWTVHDLGTLPGGGYSTAMSISNSGYIVGYAQNSAGRQRAVWFKGKGAVEIPTGPASFIGAVANKVNDAGFVAGQAEGAGFYTWYGGSVVSYGPNTGAYSVNQYNDIGGYTVPSPSYNAAYIWYGATSPWYLGHLGGGSSTTRDLHEYPLACGWSSFHQSYPTMNHAFLWYEGSMLDLGTLGGDRSGADALAVTYWPDYSFGSVWVVGHSELPSLDWHAMVWNAGVMTDLGVLPGHDQSRALDINHSKTIVGFSMKTGTSVQRAVMWSGGVMYDLNDFLPPGSGWELKSATGINEHGQIVGGGVHFGVSRAFRLDPW